MGTLGRIWHDLGFMQGPLSLSLLAVIVLTGWVGIQLFGSRTANDRRTKALIDAILFWGGFAVISGVLGTLVGIIEAAQAMEAGNTAAAGPMWGGIKQAILATTAGMTILFFASLSWFVLQLRWRLLAPGPAESDPVGNDRSRAMAQP